MIPDKMFNLIAAMCAAGVVGGFMYAGQWESAETLAVMVVSGLLALAGVKKA